jgi:hypothetical protein
VFSRGRQVAGHLQAQLPGRDDYKRAGDTAQGTFRVGGDALQHRHAERIGLTHAGAGLPDQVVAGKRHRQRQFLDGKRMCDALLGQCADNFVANSKFSKC